MNIKKPFIVEEKNILDLLSKDGNIFEIPILQRDYDWTWKNNVSVMLDDFVQVTEDFTQPEATYLLGMIVTCSTNEENRFKLIDGQQRLTTLSIICYLFHYYITKNMDMNDLYDSNNRSVEQIKKIFILNNRIKKRMVIL